MRGKNIIGGVLIMLAAVPAALAPDIKRYIKISTM